MTEPSLRIKVTDFLDTDFEQEVFQELMKIKQMDYLSGVPFPLYFRIIFSLILSIQHLFYLPIFLIVLP